MTRDECIEAVSHPGRFEGEAVYVPYFWDQYLNGWVDKDDGLVLWFDVTAEERTIFPELKGRHSVKLWQRDDGFVVEV